MGSTLHSHVNLVGWVSLMVAAMAYYLVPVLSGKPIVAPRLIDWIFWVWVPTLAINSVLMIAVGIVGGGAFKSGITGARLDAIMEPYMIAIGILSLLLG